MRLLLLCLLTFFSIQSVISQSFAIKGIIVDESGEPIGNVSVELIKPNDSTIIKRTVTNEKGWYEFVNLSKGSFLLRCSFLGYQTSYTKLKIFDADIVPEKITLMTAAQSLEGAQARGNYPPVTQKGDTSEYKAGAYKTNPDANAEDLVNKMPGVTNTNGKVQVQGEDVKTVLVDGKPFFGDDPAAALKNLPADAIDKIQVFDQKSNQSQFTGFDDGNTSKTINIITKAKYKNGLFGKVSGGYGYDDKWRGTASINAFKNERKISFLFNSNNINEQNFSADDLLGVTSSNSSGGAQGSRGSGSPGGGNRGGSGQSGGPQNASDNFLTNSKNGLVTTQAFGLNYTNKWNKLSLTGSYFFNYSSSKALSNIYRTYITGYSEGLLYLEGSQTNTKNTNQRFNLKLDWKIDSLNSIVIQPKLSMQKSNVDQIFIGENIYNSKELSRLYNLFTSNQDAYNLSAPILFRHTFNKIGRTLSINTTPGYSQSSGSNNLISLVQYTDTLSNDTINQLANLNKSGFTMSSNIVYSEQISRTSQLLINYTGNLNVNNSDKRTNQYIPAEQAYNLFDTILSNTFKSEYVSHAAGINYNYKKDKLNFSFGGNYQYASLFVNSIYPTIYTSTNPFKSFLPTAMIQYKYTQQKNIRMFFRTSNNIPGIDQLQDVINNNNPLQLTSGNSALKQDYQSSLNIRYSAANTKKSTSFFAVISGTSTKNFIANSVFIANADTILDNKILLGKGSQISKPENLNGYFNLRAFSNYSFVVSKIKSNININGFGSIVKTPSRINQDVNFALSNNVGLGLSLSSNINKDLDFTFSYNANYNTISNTLQEQLNSSYFNQNIKFKIQAMLWKGLVLQSDISRQFYNGLVQSVNTDYTLWNAGIGYKFLKSREAEVRLVIFDLLKQNASVARNTTETYYEDVKTNIIQQYFMLNFTYNIKYFKQSTLPVKSNTESSQIK